MRNKSAAIMVIIKIRQQIMVVDLPGLCPHTVSRTLRSGCSSCPSCVFHTETRTQGGIRPHSSRAGKPRGQVSVPAADLRAHPLPPRTQPARVPSTPVHTRSRVSGRGVGLERPPGVSPAGLCCTPLAWSEHLATPSPRVRPAPSLVSSEGSGTGRGWSRNVSQALTPWLRPPEADGEAQVQSPHVMPVLNRDKQDLSGTQDAGQEGGLGKPGELL